MTSLKQAKTIEKPNGTITITGELRDDHVTFTVDSDLYIDGMKYKVFPLQEVGLRKNSHKKIKAFIESYCTRWLNYLNNSFTLAIGESIKCKVKDSGNCVYIPYLSLHLNKSNIKDSAGKCVSWYDHNIFKKIEEITVTCVSTDKLKFTVPTKTLYDLAKLEKFVNSNDFQQRRLAFTNYDYALELLTNRGE